MTSLPLVTIFSRNIEAASLFYSRLFDVPRVEELSFPVFRAVKCGNLTLGFHANEAYDLLDLRDRERSDKGEVDILITFAATSKEEVDTKTALVEELGGKVIKVPAMTYYNHYQGVYSDLDGSVFRIGVPLGKVGW